MFLEIMQLDVIKAKAGQIRYSQMLIFQFNLKLKMLD